MNRDGLTVRNYGKRENAEGTLPRKEARARSFTLCFSKQWPATINPASLLNIIVRVKRSLTPRSVSKCVLRVFSLRVEVFQVGGSAMLVTSMPTIEAILGTRLCQCLTKIELD